MAEPVAWLSGPGEMAQRIREIDWAATSIGPIESWPQLLRNVLQMILDHPLPMVLGWGPDLITLYNDAYRPLLGEKADALGRPFLEVWAEAREIIEPQIAEALAGKAVRFENARFRLLRGGKREDAWFDYSYTPIRNETSGVAGILGTAVETTQAVATERQLRSSQERNAFLLKLSDALRPLADAAEIQVTTMRLLAIHLGVDRSMYAEVEGEPGAEVGVIRGQYVRSGTAGDPALPPFPDRLVYRRFGPQTMAARYRGEDLVVPDVEAHRAFGETERAAWAAANVRAAVVATLAKGGRLVAELGVQSATPRAWTETEVSLVREVAERTWAAVERARAEEALRESEGRARLLLAELQHRVRNILAMIRSVATRTANKEMSAVDYAQHLAARLDAMARIQVILTRRPGEGIEIEDLVREELLAQPTAEDRFRLSGASVLLWPKAAEVLTLAVHELVTNSIKYGALGAEGELRINWQVEARDAEQWVTLLWEEAGLEHTGPPSRRGFGTELITRRVPYELHGTGTLDFKANTMHATISFPLRSTGSILETGPSMAQED